MREYRNTSKTQLFILPFAGGSVYSYADWKRSITNEIEICFLELAGRGSRMDEPFYESVGDAVNDIYRLFMQEYDGGEYYLFGHSMGSLLAFELYYKIMEKGNKLPVHMFLSGRNPPDLCRDAKKVGNYQDIDFLNEVAKYGAVPKQMYEDEEVRKVFLPILRSDFRLLETYDCEKPLQRINCDISIFWSSDDFSTTSEKIYRWKEYGKKDVTIVEFLGDHFFLMDKGKKEIILRRIENIYLENRKEDNKVIGG